MNIIYCYLLQQYTLFKKNCCHVYLQPPVWELGYQAQGWASIAYDCALGGDGWRWEVAGVRLNLESNENKNKKSVEHTYNYVYVCSVGRNRRWGKNIPQTKKGSLATLFFCF